MSTNSVYMITMSILFDNQSLSLLELMALIFALSGVSIIAFGEKLPCMQTQKEVIKVEL